MKIRILKTTETNYGVFTKGRVINLPPNMLERLPKDSYEPVESAQKVSTETSTETSTESQPVEAKEGEVENGKDTSEKSSEGNHEVGASGKSSEENKRVRDLSSGRKRGKRSRTNSD